MANVRAVFRRLLVRTVAVVVTLILFGLFVMLGLFFIDALVGIGMARNSATWLTAALTVAGAGVCHLARVRRRHYDDYLRRCRGCAGTGIAVNAHADVPYCATCGSRSFTTYAGGGYEVQCACGLSRYVVSAAAAGQRGGQERGSGQQNDDGKQGNAETAKDGR